MKKGEHVSDEHKAKMKAGRDAYIARLRAEKAERDAKKAEHPEVVAKVDSGTVAIRVEPATAAEIVTANGHATLLDIRDPIKWQMKVRLFLETCETDAIEQWVEGIRLIAQMAGVLGRDSVYRRVTRRCYICDKPFPEGRPAGEAGYYDGDRNYIKVYCCHNAEYSKLLEKCQAKEAAVTAWMEKAEKAAQQALTDAHSAARKAMPA